MSLLHVLDRLSEHEPQNFAAPVLTRTTTQLFTVQENLPYWFEVEVNQPGWYELKPNKDTGKAIVVRVLDWIERVKYLEQLRRFLVFALYPIEDQTWLCSPFNLSDAEQRGWYTGSPKPIFVLQGTIKPLDVLDVRIQANNLLFCRVASERWNEAHGLSARMHAESFIEKRVNFLAQEEARKAREEKRKTVSGRIKQSVEFMGATLNNLEMNATGYTITWTYNGRTYTMPVDRNLHVRSAGVCLDGTDNWHSLSSIIGVMEDSYNQRGY